jgi:hypothetical protein
MGPRRRTAAQLLIANAKLAFMQINGQERRPETTTATTPHHIKI